MLGYFPALDNRLSTPAGSLSGGEQQMLSLAMAFIAQPRLMIIDELSLGLAPTVIESLLEIVKAINERGTAVILVEQSVNLALRHDHPGHLHGEGPGGVPGPDRRADRARGDRPVGPARRGPPAGRRRAPAHRPPPGRPGPTGRSRPRRSATCASTPRRAPPAAEAAGVVLSAEGIVKRFGGVLAVDDVSLELQQRRDPRASSGPTGPARPPCSRSSRASCARTPGTSSMHDTDISDWPAYRRSALRPRSLLPGRPAVARADRPGDRLARGGPPGRVARASLRDHAVLADRRAGREAGGGGRPTRSSTCSASATIEDQLGSDLSTGSAAAARAGGHRGPATLDRPARRALGRPGAGRDRGAGPGAPGHPGAACSAA